MGYYWLNKSFTVNGESKSSMVGMPSDTLEQAIAEARADILETYPGATDIVIGEEPKNKGSTFAVDILIDKILEFRPDLTREHLLDCEHHILLTNRDSYMQGSEVVTLAEAKTWFDEDRDYRDFVYIRRFDMVIFNVVRDSSHEMFMANMDWILSNLLDDTSKDLDDMPYFDPSDRAEYFLTNGHGFFVSSVGGYVAKSVNFKLNAIEKAIFKNHRFRDIDAD